MVTFPDVPQAITGSKDRTEALTMAEDALATALAGYVHAQWEIPTPSQPVAGQELVAVPTVVAAKLALYSAMRAQRISNAELACQLGISESAVQKLIDPDRSSPIGSDAEGPPSGWAQFDGRDDHYLKQTKSGLMLGPGDRNADTHYV